MQTLARLSIRNARFFFEWEFFRQINVESSHFSLRFRHLSNLSFPEWILERFQFRQSQPAFGSKSLHYQQNSETSELIGEMNFIKWSFHCDGNQAFKFSEKFESKNETFQAKRKRSLYLSKSADKTKNFCRFWAICQIFLRLSPPKNWQNLAYLSLHNNRSKFFLHVLRANFCVWKIFVAA